MTSIKFIRRAGLKLTTPSPGETDHVLRHSAALRLGRLHEQALGLATALSREQGSRLVALAGASVVVPVATGWMYYPAVYTALHEPAKETVRMLATSLEERLAGAG